MLNKMIVIQKFSLQKSQSLSLSLCWSALSLIVRKLSDDIDINLYFLPSQCQKTDFIEITNKAKNPMMNTYSSFEAVNLNQIFPDESRVLVFQNTGCYIWRPKNSKNISKYVSKTLKYGIMPLLVMETISSDGERIMIKCHHMFGFQEG